MSTMAIDTQLKPADFESDQEARWCPGCGDYAILKAIQRVLADEGVRREKTVFVSGIGCASRFPYYVSTYGFHSIHGRAPAIATGLKLANPDLDVWVVTGDGDALSIGGNHTLHVLRRNVDLQILLFNNEIYGLTKGQYSPTSRQGTLSPSSPQGSVDNPVSAGLFALGAGARFVARAVDRQQKHLIEVLKRAHQHRGASFVEIFQNCNVFNDGAFADFTDKAVAEENQILLEHGQPMLFGKDKSRGLRMKHGCSRLEVVQVGDGGVAAEDVLVHDEKDPNLAALLIAMEPPEHPVALGVVYCNPAATYENLVYARISTDAPGSGELSDLLRTGRTWRVE